MCILVLSRGFRRGSRKYWTGDANVINLSDQTDKKIRAWSFSEHYHHLNTILNCLFSTNSCVEFLNKWQHFYSLPFARLNAIREINKIVPFALQWAYSGQENAREAGIVRKILAATPDIRIIHSESQELTSRPKETRDILNVFK